MSTGLVATLKRELKCFSQPDVRSELLGMLPARTFTVLEVRERSPTPDTDYVRLSTPGVGSGEAWICSRWEHQRYAEVEDADPFRNDPMAIDEALLVKYLRDFTDYTYSLKGPISYPWPLPGVDVNTQPPRLINCCTFVEGLLVKAWEEAKGSQLDWSKRRHDQMMIAGQPRDYFSPVTAVIEAGMAVPVESTEAPPPAWTLIQGWDRGYDAGHTFLLVAHHAAEGKILTLEANHSFKLNGVGFRELGMAEAFGFSPPSEWWTHAEVWTWEKLRTHYVNHKLARLKITHLQWA